jgi:predicted transcriptional regulator
MKHHNDTTKGHKEIMDQNIKDTYRNSNVLNTFFKNTIEKSFFIYGHKLEKVTAAIYLVTDVMDDHIPLTHSLRQVSTELLGLTFQHASERGGDIGQKLTQFLVHAEHLVSLLTIGKIAHHISEMNADVLIHELQKMIQLVTLDIQDITSRQTSFQYAHKDNLAIHQPVVTHSIIEDALFDDFEKNRKRQNDIKDTLKDISNMRTAAIATPSIQMKETKEQMASLVINDTSEKIVKKTETPTSLSDRSQEIVNVIKSHKNTTIADIQKYVTSCSSKTIQREIQNLINTGIVKKDGDKRWATYHLIDKR